ncbi:YggL family protein [Vibrio sp.]|uniref:YggL 50S ribosome-binding family protein n=1 Tax=Vibrio sp. TaxID=678 RepID=UPI003D0A2E6F
MAKNRSRRLRKKLYVDEFAVYGFSFSCQLSVDSDKQVDSLIDEFVDFIERRDLVMGGGADQTSFDGFIVPEGRYESAKEEDRLAVDNWLSQRPECSNVEVSALTDANQSF